MLRHVFSIVKSFSILSLLILITGCTSGSGQQSSVSQIIGNIIGTNPSAPAEAQKQVQEIQSALNTDSQYALTSEDSQLLESQGLVENKDSLKAWVK